MTDAPLVHEIFERQAETRPSAIALIHGDWRVTYQELNQRANQVAHHLRKLGVGPEVFVGVCLERSIDVAISLLGILKAGGAYVYLDPSLPQTRLEELRTDSQPRLIVTNSELQSRAGDESLCLDIRSSGLSGEDSADIPSFVKPDNPAYVLYTSGSTGKPKGVVEIHRCLTARLSPGELPDIQERDVCCLNSSFGSGITASRLFLPLALGATVVICSDADVRDAHRFLPLLESQGITSAYFPPALLKTLLSLDRNTLARLNHLRAVTVTGSALTPELVASFFKSFPSALLVNVYGSTEIGTTATLQVMDRVSASRISIGRAVSNTKVYLLDEKRAPVPAEMIGEIYISAPHMAREYLNQPELTAERFLPNPFVLGERIYRTGDLGRSLPNGEILLLGRLDRQVKVRGFRIELDEIEAVLEEHEKVLEAVVIAQPDPEAENRLVAYFVTQPGANVAGTELRRFLSGRLPSHMVPSAFIRLIELPRTHSGKVDRQALPSYPVQRDVGSQYEAPRDPVEAALAGIWSDVLKVESIGIHDNFLELGGDSLSATQVIVRLRDRFDMNLTLESLFDQTIAEIATRCKTAASG